MGTIIRILKVAAKASGLTYEEYMSRIQSGLKRCTKCKAWKPITKFGKDSTRGDGHDAKCLICRHVVVRKCTKGRISPLKGHHLSDETKRKISEKAKSRIRTKGRRNTPEQRLNISNGTKAHALSGADNPRWKGGISPANQKARYSFEMKEWRRKVFERDHFICQKCGYNKGHILIAHHIKSFSGYPELRLAVDNGITVCKSCHQLIRSV